MALRMSKNASSWRLHCPMPSKRPGSPVNGGLLANHTSTTATPTHFLTMIQLITSPENLISVSALTDFGTDGSFMDCNLPCHLQLDLKTISGSCQICALNGHLLCQVIYQTPPLSLLISGNQNEKISF